MLFRGVILGMAGNFYDPILPIPHIGLPPFYDGAGTSKIKLINMI